MALHLKNGMYEIIYQLSTFEEVAQSCAEQIGTPWQDNYCELPDYFGKGIIEAYNYDHFSIMSSRFHLTHPTTVARAFSPLQGYLAFDFILNGITDSFSTALNNIHELSYGVYIISPSTYGSGDFGANIQHDHFSILVEKDWLESFWGQALPPIMQDTSRHLMVHYSIKSQLVPVLSLLVKSPAKTRFRKQYFYAKFFEIITLTLESIIEDESHRSEQDFHPDDVNTILQTAAFIQEHLGEHLTIEGLAKEFNLNRDKLQVIFKSIYGKTIAEYVRYTRMNLAYKMLLQRKNVTEVGYQLGYTNMSHFSKAFRKVHGFNPSTVLKSDK